MKLQKSTLKIAIPTLLFFGADQLTKWWASLSLNPEITLTDWFSFRYAQNVGIAWSIAIPQPWLSIMNVILLIILPIYISRHIDLRRNDAQFFLSMVIGGALGNLYDRLTHGYVIDFISVGWFPVFNLADAFLTIGIFLILLFYGRIRRT